jgi:hypothetical protein
MFDALTLTEVDSQHVELLPARTMLSMLTDSSVGAAGESGSNSVGTPTVNVLGVPLGVPKFGR